MADRRFEELLERNQRSLGNYQAPPLLQNIVEMKPESGAICIITCADARVNPDEFLGLTRGEALVIRNAGGRAADALRSLEVMGSIAPIDLIVVVHHTDCGGLFTNDDEIRSKLCDRAPAHASTITDKWFGTFQSIGLDESIREDVEAIRQWPFLPVEAQVVGYAYELETGSLRKVVPGKDLRK
ncbi:beta-class carbonic anhydrase [Aspergillus alliaceus]|uniref:beta-class carbonic anhydrase n=1 Tax=Petromyces alliaceus TaxID=209559 RepID=UPI0012A69BDB|nr:carbonic anhydrase [Aspergillus alliaceus]KAB8234325.1 carbonic anhydrase [Aspergillus alliaceus]